MKWIFFGTLSLVWLLNDNAFALASPKKQFALAISQRIQIQVPGNNNNYDELKSTTDSVNTNFDHVEQSSRAFYIYYVPAFPDLAILKVATKCNELLEEAFREACIGNRGKTVTLTSSNKCYGRAFREYIATRGVSAVALVEQNIAEFSPETGRTVYCR